MLQMHTWAVVVVLCKGAGIQCGTHEDDLQRSQLLGPLAGTAGCSAPGHQLLSAYTCMFVWPDRGVGMRFCTWKESYDACPVMMPALLALSKMSPFHLAATIALIFQVLQFMHEHQAKASRPHLEESHQEVTLQ